MRRISANYIFTSKGIPLKNGIIEVDDEGTIKSVIDTKGELKESRSLEFFNGVITPGFINAHCHLELSDQKGIIPQKQGLPKFLEEIIKSKRQRTSNQEIISNYDSMMRQQGIVAVGDIANTNETIIVKQKSRIYYHTFVEAIGLSRNSAEIFQKSKQLQQQYSDKDLPCSIVPHAPYTVSKELFLLIKEYAQENNSIISFHNQESDSENEMFISGSGDLINAFKKSGIDLSCFSSTGKNSIQTIMEWLPRNSNIIFVHNTFSSKEDVDLVNQNFKKAFWCLCPSSNLNLEDQLPDLNLFKSLPNVVLGTDSLASNDSLSVLNEMKVIVDHYPDIEFQTLHSWATLNGAKALKIDDAFGSIEVNKSPGINLITNFDFEKMQITKKSKVKVLV